MYKLMFGVDTLEIRRKKPVNHNKNVLNEGSDNGDEVIGIDGPIINEKLRNATILSSQPSIGIKNNF